MRVFLFGTTNPGKVTEARAVFSSFGLDLIAPYDLHLTNFAKYGLKAWPGNIPDVAEVGVDYLSNARLKARAFFEWSGLPAFADDSGLEVEALGGAPGVYSARFAGENKNFDLNISKLLKLLAGQRNRRACFRSVICYLSEKGELITEGILRGEIGYERRGKGGFGYDSVFVVEGGKQTLSEMKDQGWVCKTHRVLALEALANKLVGF